MAKWALQDAKNRLSEVIRKASDEGPQVITLRGKDAVVVVARERVRADSRGSRGHASSTVLSKSPLAARRTRSHTQSRYGQARGVVSWLLDTCVICELARRKPSASVVNWVRSCNESELFLSVITIGELERGIAKLRDSARRTLLERWVRHELAERFRDRLLVIDSSVAARWGALVGQSETRGQPLPVIDSLIAATSLQHDFIVVTRNTDDLERCGARCFNPWVGTHASPR